MNFFKKMMGYGEDLPTLIKSTTIDHATFYKIIKDARNVMYEFTLTLDYQTAESLLP